MIEFKNLKSKIINPKFVFLLSSYDDFLNLASSSSVENKLSQLSQLKVNNSHNSLSIQGGITNNNNNNFHQKNHQDLVKAIASLQKKPVIPNKVYIPSLF